MTKFIEKMLVCSPAWKQRALENTLRISQLFHVCRDLWQEGQALSSSQYLLRASEIQISN